jgi:23S rRNA pseudouridine1911/1915/1917 synthase
MQSRNNNWKPDRIISRANTTQDPKPLLEFLQIMLPDQGRNSVKALLKYGQVELDGVITSQFDSPVLPGHSVAINLSRPFITFRHPRLKIIYEDNDVIVVNKGYGLLSMGTEKKQKDLTAYSALKDYVKKIHPSNKIFIVHRLDRDTSGLMMFAKNIEAQEIMRHNWNNMVLDRTYVAVLEGVMEEDSGVIRSRLAENSQYEVYTTHNEDEGKLAVTRYRVLDRGNGFTLCEFSLDTGRKNQIRVHAKDLGHPIVGDRKYGAKSSPIARLALHARTLRFVHPITRKDMHFELPIPTRFLSLVAKRTY